MTGAAGAQPPPPVAPWQRAYIGLGANLGDALATLQAVRDAIAAWPHSRLVACSAPYRSAPVEATGPDFVNAVLAIDTTLDGHALLAALQALEQHHGRQRPFHHAPRTLDLDLLLLGDTVCQTADLHLPHPRLHLRAFVLKPLLELAPTLHAPGLGPLTACLPAVANQPIARMPGWPQPAGAYNPFNTN